jgi:prevent-host-death family protein
LPQDDGQAISSALDSGESVQIVEVAMHTVWQLQEAKNNLSQLIKRAVSGDAQVVTVHGKPTAVVVSAEEYARLTRPRQGKLSDALLRPDIAGEDLEFCRAEGGERP